MSIVTSDFPPFPEQIHMDHAPDMLCGKFRSCLGGMCTVLIVHFKIRPVLPASLIHSVSVPAASKNFSSGPKGCAFWGG